MTLFVFAINARKNTGLTFMEMLAVLIIAVVLLLATIPSFINFLQDRRLVMTAESLYAATQQARGEAIKANTTVYVSFVTGDTWCIGMNSGSSCTCSTPSTCNLGTISAPQSQQLSLSTTGLTSNTFTFEGSRGAANVSGAKVTLTVYGQSSSISLLISQLGNVQLCSAMSGYQTCP